MLYIQPAIFDDEKLFVASSVRQGGVSTGAYASMNLGFHTNDDAEKVLNNRRRFFNEAGIPLQRSVFLKQVHGTAVYVAEEQDAGRGAMDYESAISDNDGLITKVKNLPIVIQTADCLPVVIYDVKEEIVANLHCGWRSLQGGIIENAIDIMKTRFFSDPRNMTAFLSVCISEESYEVSEDVALLFDFPIKRNGKYYVDLRKEAIRRMINMGISEERMEMSVFDTCIDDELFFSYRRDGKNTGRMLTAAMLL